MPMARTLRIFAGPNARPVIPHLGDSHQLGAGVDAGNGRSGCLGREAPGA